MNKKPYDQQETRKAMTDPQIDPDVSKMIGEFLVKMMKLSKRETEACIRCGQKVERIVKVGRCVYARPCGCRLWQGTVPDAWKPSK